MRYLLKLIKYHPSIAIGTATLTLLCIIALLAPWLGTIDPTARCLFARFIWGPGIAYRWIYRCPLIGSDRHSDRSGSGF